MKHLKNEQRETEADSGVRYLGEYQYRGDDTWYVAGDIYGYPTIEQAREVNVKESARRGPRGEVVFATRVHAIVTTAFVVEETEV